jgi:hypothetical protein
LQLPRPLVGRGIVLVYRAALTRHRERVQTWFDGLPAIDKDQLAEWMTMFEWDTCVALSAAAGDWQKVHAMNAK